MSKLFIANTMKQDFEFHFWVGENKRPITTKIRMGSQIMIYEQGTRSDHDHIIEQHQMYGLKPVSEIDRTQEFVGLCYQFDKPIPLDRLQSTFQHNDDAMAHAAQEHRKLATLSMDHSLKQAAQETDSSLQNFEVEVIEQQQKGVDTKINETIVVEHSTAQSRGRGRPRREN